MRSLFILLVAVAPLGGCVSLDTSEFFRERVEITKDDLDAAPAAPATERVTLDVEVEGYTTETAPLLDAMVKGLGRDPGIELRRLHYRGEEAWRPNALRSLEPPPPGEEKLTLACHPEFSASAANAAIAFPGMLPFLPIWLGYGWEMQLTVSWSIQAPGAPAVPGGRTVTASYRELNARRSALFHLWPSTGFYGTQFVLGLILAPTFWIHDAETTPLLVAALEPRLGTTIASAVRRDLVASRALGAMARLTSHDREAGRAPR